MRQVRPVLRALIGATVVALLGVALTVPRTPAAPLRTVLAYARPRAVEAYAAISLPSALATSTPRRVDTPPEPVLARAASSSAAPTSPNSRPRRTQRARSAGGAVTGSAGSEIVRARQLLNAQVRRYPLLSGTTVEMGDAAGYQAISYYRSGRIVISPSHTAGLERIVAHEVWHVIDWRDNGRIDWGENIPPKNASGYTGPR